MHTAQTASRYRTNNRGVDNPPLNPAAAAFGRGKPAVFFTLKRLISALKGPISTLKQLISAPTGLISTLPVLISAPKDLISAPKVLISALKDLACGDKKLKSGEMKLERSAFSLTPGAMATAARVVVR